MKIADKVLEKERVPKGTAIHINSDVTPADRNIQKEIRKIGKEEGTKGKTVKIGNKKQFHRWKRVRME